MNSVLSPMRVPLGVHNQPPALGHATTAVHAVHAAAQRSAARLHQQQQQHLQHRLSPQPQPQQHQQLRGISPMPMPTATATSKVLRRVDSTRASRPPMQQPQPQTTMLRRASSGAGVATKPTATGPEGVVSLRQYHYQQQQQQHPPQQQRQRRETTTPSQQQQHNATAAPTTTTRRAQSPPKPAEIEWRVAVDPKTKRPYYYHPVTRETTWKKPSALVEREKRERAQFFAAMEGNIRAKLRAGNWFRDSLTGPVVVDDNNQQQHDQDSDHDDDHHSGGGLLLSSPASTSTSSRSSWSSSSHNPKELTAPKLASQSMPCSPETGVVARDNNAEDALLAAAAAARPPVLFRTLSSYETPVVGETKKLANGRLIAVPSPIQERVRLAIMDELPRSSDLEPYAHRRPPPVVRHSLTGQPLPSATTTEVVPRQPLRRRSNSTSTIFVRMGTMNAPDQDTTIHCVATVLRAHLMEALAQPITLSPTFGIFARDEDTAPVPSLKDIGAFMKHVFARAQMESECIIMSLIYVERLLKATTGELQLRPCNWRSILFCSMVMASKVWDDLSMCNADFSKIWPELSLREINELELAYLSAVEYNVRVSAVSYAKYYFHLRSMCASMGMLAAFDESAPLNLDGARKMQVLSEEYQERSKLLPAPRRRSVTITTPSATSGGRTAALTNQWTAKSSPAVSLEELVRMQVRGAGGEALSSMHRLTSKPPQQQQQRP